MAYMKEMEQDIIEAYNNNKDTLPINLIIDDLAQRYCISREAMAYEFQKVLGGKEDDTHMMFKDRYVEHRWKGGR